MTGCGTCWCCRRYTPVPTSNTSTSTTLTSTTATTTRKAKWAYVMMAYDKDGKMSDSMWGVLAVAKALKTFSRYPLLLLTNTTEFPDGTDVQAAFSQLNTVILPVLEVEMQGTQGWSLERWTFAFWKLQIWRLTDYDKLIWLDADALVYRSLDFIFDREWMWAQRDAWFCDLDAPKVCSGIMSVYPSEEDFEGLLKYAAKVGSSLTSGDQQLIEWYFRDVRNKPVHLLSPLEASFGQCSGTAISPYLTKEGMDVAGMWSVPAFIHKSGGYDNTVVNSYTPGSATTSAAASSTSATSTRWPRPGGSSSALQSRTWASGSRVRPSSATTNATSWASGQVMTGAHRMVSTLAAVWMSTSMTPTTAGLTPGAYLGLCS